MNGTVCCDERDELTYCEELCLLAPDNKIKAPSSEFFWTLPEGFSGP